MSLPRYSEYKDSGVEWLGRVPSHWSQPKLKHLARFSGGGTPDRANPVFWNGDIPWVSPKDMKTENIEGAEEYITDAGLSGSSTSVVLPGRVLMVVRSGILKHTIPVAINTVDVALNQDMKALSFENTCTGIFFLRWVQGLNDVLLLEWAKQGATVESIEHAYLANTVVPLPSVAEQTAITTFLDRETAKIDGLIAEQEKLIGLLAEKRQATISHAVTKGLNPGVPMKDSGVEWLGNVPTGWSCFPVKRLFRLVVEPAPDGNDEELLSIYTDIGVRPRKSLEAKGNKATTTDGYWRVKKGDIIVNKLLAWMGAIGLSDYDGVTSPAYDILRGIKPLHPKFFDYLFRCGVMFTEFRRYSRGIMDMRLRLYFEELGQIIVPFPPLDEQKQIIEFLDQEAARADALSAAATHSIDLLKERRSALISAAVTGKIDVRHLAEAEAA